MMRVEHSSKLGTSRLDVYDGDELVAYVLFWHQSDQIVARKLWVEESRRGDDDFAVEVYPLIIAKTVELGWITDDDIADYQLTDKGAKVGKMLVAFGPQEVKGSTVRFRTVARGVAEEKASLKGRKATDVLSDDVAEIIKISKHKKHP